MPNPCPGDAGAEGRLTGLTGQAGQLGPLRLFGFEMPMRADPRKINDLILTVDQDDLLFRDSQKGVSGSAPQTRSLSSFLDWLACGVRNAASCSLISAKELGFDDDINNERRRTGAALSGPRRRRESRRPGTRSGFSALRRAEGRGNRACEAIAVEPKGLRQYPDVAKILRPCIGTAEHEHTSRQ